MHAWLLFPVLGAVAAAVGPPRHDRPFGVPLAGASVIIFLECGRRAGSCSTKNWAANESAPVRALRDRRFSRVTVYLAIAWLLALLDLSCTYAAHIGGEFVELNPIAAPFLDRGWAIVSCFKLALISFPTGLALTMGRFRAGEYLALLVLGIHVFVAHQWAWYYIILVQ